MLKILCITTGLTGITNASFELVRRLQQLGYEVKYASPRAIRQKVEQEGICFIQLPFIAEDVSPPVPTYTGIFRKLKRLSFKISNAKERQTQTLKNIYPNTFIQVLQRESPDLCLIDVELHEYIFAAHQLGQPFLILSQWFSLWNQKGLPYLLHNTIPGQGWRGSTWMLTLSWKKVQVQRWWIFAKKWFLSGGTNRRSALLALAKEMRFPLKYIPENYWPGPFTYSQLPVLSMTALEMEFPHKPRPNLYYIGPMVYAKRKEAIAKGKIAVEEVLHLKRQTNKQLLYASVSTLSKGDLLFIQKLIKAVKKQHHWLLIIGLGGLIQQMDMEEMPENVFSYSFVPQLKVLQQANLSINHGGIHTIHECMRFEVPMLVYSGKRSDQNGCAARVAYHGLGIMADKDKDSSIDIKNNIEKILSNHTLFQNKIKEMNKQIAKYQALDNLNNICESVMRRNTKQSTS